jgi:hypothetical protein
VKKPTKLEGEMDLDELMGKIDSLLEDEDFADLKLLDQEDDDEGEYMFSKQIRDGSDTSSNSTPQGLLNLEEFQASIPNIVSSDFTFVSTITRTFQIIDKLGDPSQSIIRKYFINRHNIKHLSGKEKYGLMVRCRELLMNIQKLNDHEIIFILTLLDHLLEDLEFHKKWSVDDSIDLKFFTLNGDEIIGLFAEYHDFLDENTKKILISKGSLEHNGIMLIKPKEERMMRITEESMKPDELDKLMNTKPLKDAYYRIFKQPFYKSGYVNMLISELI